MHKSCIYEVPNGVPQDIDFLSQCKYIPEPQPNLQIYAMDVHFSPSGGKAVTAMNASWTVPSLPKSNDGQVVYFWPGFKSTAPTMGLPVLQPVLQYGQHGASWQLQSWFVWGNNGISVTGPAISCNPGDKIESHMSYDSLNKIWTVYGVNLRTGQSSNLQINRSRACNCDYKWAMLVLETIMTQGACRDYPASPTLTFTDVSVDGEYPEWTTRVQMKDCKQAIKVTSKDTVELSWSN